MEEEKIEKEGTEEATEEKKESPKPWQTKNAGEKTEAVKSSTGKKDESGKPVEEASLPAGEAGVRELLEKNLKWSQIIYEQNRRISRRLLWNAIADWLRLALIIAPLVLAVWYFWPIIKNVRGQLIPLLSGGAVSGIGLDSATMEKVLKLLPLDSSQGEQLKGLLK